jgi:hypothetical protein
VLREQNVTKPRHRNRTRRSDPRDCKHGDACENIERCRFQHPSDRETSAERLLADDAAEVDFDGIADGWLQLKKDQMTGFFGGSLYLFESALFPHAKEAKNAVGHRADAAACPYVPNGTAVPLGVEQAWGPWSVCVHVVPAQQLRFGAPKARVGALTECISLNELVSGNFSYHLPHAAAYTV